MGTGKWLLPPFASLFLLGRAVMEIKNFPSTSVGKKGGPVDGSPLVFVNAGR
jgi:hypothetical protein